MTKYFFLDKKFVNSPQSIQYCLSVLFNIYFFLVFFDIMRDALPFPSILNILVSGIRDVSLYLIVLYVFSTKKSVVLGYKTFYIPQVLVCMEVGGASNKNTQARLSKTQEDRVVLKKNQVGAGYLTVACKQLRKIKQFLC